MDKAFVGSAGIDLEAGKVMNFEANDGNTKKEIMNISKKSFLSFSQINTSKSDKLLNL